jgi:hypothetical protein
MLVWFVRSGWIGGGTADKGLPGLLAWLFPKR